MLPRQTSLDAYERIQEDGTLSRAQKMVYAALYHSENGLTRNELDSQLAPGAPNAAYSRRLADMERAGIVARVDVRKCRISSHECEVWDVTSATPIKPAKGPPPPPAPTSEQAVILLPQIDARIDALRVAMVTIPSELEMLRAWLAAGAPRRGAPRPSTTAPPALPGPSTAVPVAPSPPPAALPAPPATVAATEPTVQRPFRATPRGQGILF